LVHDSEVAAARTLLQLLANSGASADDGALPGTRLPATGHSAARDKAEEAFALRQRRMEMFEGSIGTESPFALLVTLYVYEDREPDISVRLLAKLAWLAYTTTVRWVDELDREGLVRLKPHRSDARAHRVALTKMARAALEKLCGDDG
jgi:DNA-binding MarR family transcriptional regulator